MERTTVAEYAVRVERGARLFDVKRPGWAAKVNQDLLDMGDPTACVMSQVGGDRFTYVAVQFFSDFTSDWRHLSVDHGLDILTDYLIEYGYSDYKILTELWINEVRKRVDH